MKHKYMGLAIILLVLALPAPVYADLIFPSISYNTFIEANEEKSLLIVNNLESDNFTVICRNNGTGMNLTLREYNETSLITQENFRAFNFSLFSFRLKPSVTYFTLSGHNEDDIRIKIYLDIYPISLNAIDENSLVLFPIDDPSIEYIEVPVYVPVLIQNNITEYVVVYENVTITKVVDYTHTEYLMDTDTAILVAIGGISILIVYIAIRTKKEENKPIKKLTLDDMLEEFRRGK